MSKKFDFSENAFKKFLEDQEPSKLEKWEDDDLTGKEVAPKINSKKMLEAIEVEEGEEDDLIEEFMKNGGVILETDNENSLIEVKSGSFYLRNKYFRRKD